jgi:hypothetical protein
MNRIKRAIATYLIATGACIIPSVIIMEIANELLVIDIPVWHAIGALWLLVVGLPSMAASASEVARVLGRKDRPWVTGSNMRHIPVFGDVAAFLNRRSGVTIDVADRLTFGLGQVVVSEGTMRHFLVRAWSRQQAGHNGLSRLWWVEEGRHIDRTEYEAIVQVLLAHGYIERRQQGHSGRLTTGPMRIFTELKHAYGDG